MIRVFVIALLLLSSFAEASLPTNFKAGVESTVQVRVIDRSGKTILEGKGYVIDKEGLIATECEMILRWYEDIKNDLIVRTVEDKVFSLHRLISYNPRLNLAIFKINTDSLPVAAIPSDDRIAAYIKRTVKVYKDMVHRDLRESMKPSISSKAKANVKALDSSNAAPYGMGIGYASLGRYREAIEEFIKALKTEPDNPEIYVNLGLAYYKVDRYRESIDAYKKALELGYTSKSIHERLGTLYLISGEYDRAIQAFQATIQLDSKDPKSHFNLAIAFFMKGDKDSAWQEYAILRSLDEELSRRLWDIIN